MCGRGPWCEVKAGCPPDNPAPHLLLALGAHPHALGRCLERRVQAAEVVGPRASAAGLQIGPKLAGGAALIVADLILEEKGGEGVGQPGPERGWGPPGRGHPDLLVTLLPPVFLSSSGRDRDQPRRVTSVGTALGTGGAAA